MYSFCLWNFPWWMNSSLALSQQGQVLTLKKDPLFRSWGWRLEAWGLQRENSFLEKGNPWSVLISLKVLPLGGFRADGGLCVIALWSLSLVPLEADLGIHSWSCESWAYFLEMIPCSSQMETKLVFLHLHQRVSKHSSKVIERLHERKLSEKLGSRPGSVTDWNSESANGMHTCPANSGQPQPVIATTSNFHNQWNWQQLDHNFEIPSKF